MLRCRITRYNGSLVIAVIGVFVYGIRIIQFISAANKYILDLWMRTELKSICWPNCIVASHGYRDGDRTSAESLPVIMNLGIKCDVTRTCQGEHSASELSWTRSHRCINSSSAPQSRPSLPCLFVHTLENGLRSELRPL
jgi:hypothetical protein